MAREAVRQHVLRPDTPPGAVREIYWRWGTLAGAFAVSIPVAFVTQWAYLCWIAIPYVARVSRRVKGGPRLGNRRLGG